MSESTGQCGKGGAACGPCSVGQQCNGAGQCACIATSCSSGCCDANGNCQTSSAGTCGVGGVACHGCSSTQQCSAAGQCVCNATSCPGGCCSGTSCVPYASQTTSACGAGGASCGTCSVAGETCSSTGACSCPSGSGQVCSNACTNVMTDKANCGTCGHPCLGGSCLGGLCQPVTLATTTNTWVYIAVDANNVYWPSNGLTVYSCPINGGCGNGNALYSVPAGSPVTGNVQGLTVAPAGSAFGGYVFALASDPGNDVYLLPTQISNGSTTPALLNLYEAVGLVYDPSNDWLYTSEQLGMPGTFCLNRMKRDGTQLQYVLSTFSSVSGYLGIDSSNVYVPDSGANRVVYCPLTGTCSNSNVEMNVSAPTAAFSDGTNCHCPPRRAQVLTPS